MKYMTKKRRAEHKTAMRIEYARALSTFMEHTAFSGSDTSPQREHLRRGMPEMFMKACDAAYTAHEAGNDTSELVAGAGLSPQMRWDFSEVIEAVRLGKEHHAHLKVIFERAYGSRWPDIF